jgi:chemotaxis protein methyltransferase CheR
VLDRKKVPKLVQEPQGQPVLTTEEPTFSEPDFLEFATRIRVKFGLDLLSYKQPQVRRRLNSLRIRKGYDTFAEFFRRIDASPQAQKEFIDQLTINVTEFYRNPERWQVLSEHIIPELLSQTQTLKCWSAACSTGEEPYTLAMVMSAHLPLRRLDILATDLDATVIRTAKTGFYAPEAVKVVPPDMSTRHLSVDADGRYKVSDDIKQRVRFQEHNLLFDPPESGFDLIVCRNVLIYFTPVAKGQLIARFSQALRPGGYLFVGGTEQITNAASVGLESPYTFFYRKR